MTPARKLPVAVLLAAAGAALASPVRASAVDEPDGIRWVEADLDVALGRALDRNIPLVVFACLVDEEHNEEFRHQIGNNARLGAGLADAVPMYASNGDPPPGAELTRHKELMNAVYNRWVAEETPDGEWKLPEVLLIDPQGEVLRRLGSGHGVPDDEILRALAAVQKQLGDPVTEEERVELVALRQAGRDAHERQDAVGAWRAWRAILAITPDGPFAAEASRLVGDAEKIVLTRLAGLAEGLDATNLADRYALARDVLRHSKGTDLARPAQAAVKKLEKDKRFRVELRALRLEEDAEDLLAEVEALLRTGDGKGADRVLRRLLAKKFAATAAYARAKERHGARLEKR